MRLSRAFAAWLVVVVVVLAATAASSRADSVDAMVAALDPDALRVFWAIDRMSEGHDASVAAYCRGQAADRVLALSCDLGRRLVAGQDVTQADAALLAELDRRLPTGSPTELRRMLNAILRDLRRRRLIE